MTKQSALRKIAEGLFEYADAMFEDEQAAAGATTRPVAVSEVPDFPPIEYETLPFTAEQVETTALSRCPAHDRPWTVKAAGVSKAGKAYNAFWKCDGKDPDGTYCNRKPVKAWADAHVAA